MVLCEIQIPGDEGCVWGARDVYGKAWNVASLGIKNGISIQCMTNKPKSGIACALGDL